MSLLARYKRGSSSLSIYKKDHQLSTVKRMFLSANIPVLEPLDPSKGKSSVNIKNSNSSNKIPQSEREISDTVVDCNGITTSSHIDVIISKHPVLPPASSPEFGEIFNLRVNSCSVMCDFSSEQFDRKAKELKSEYLQDFALLLDSKMINCLDNVFLLKLFEMVCFHVFRIHPDVPKKFIFSDDLVVITESSYPHLSLVYNILSILIKKQLLPEKLTIGFVSRLIGRFFAPDINERNEISALISLWLDHNPSFYPQVITNVKHKLIDYLNGQCPPHVLVPCLTLLQKVLIRNPSLNQEIYNEIILPVFRAPHYVCCHIQVMQIIEVIIDHNNSFAIDTITYLIQHWPKTRTTKQVHFLQILIYCLCNISKDEFKLIRVPLFKIIAKASVSPHSKVSEAAFALWNKNQIETFIIESSHVVYPIMFAALQKGLKDAWSQNITENINNIYEVMNKLDSFVFQELIRGKSVKKPEVPVDKVRLWANISRTASKSDKDLNLAIKLSEIQRLFAPTSEQVVKTSLPPQRKTSVPITRQSVTIKW